MGHYKSNVRDLEFNLFELLELEKALDGAIRRPRRRLGAQMLAEAARLAEGPVAESFAETDRHPPTLRSRHACGVDCPSRSRSRCGPGSRGSGSASGSTRRSAASRRRRWSPGRSTSWCWAPTRRSSCTWPARSWPTSCSTSATTQQRHWAQLWPSERNWCATMVLTEPDAGSDVGAGRTKAVDAGDGTWHIEGVKRFITNGDTDDMFENIMHLVLARPEGAGPGTKGLSLFLVPKFLLDPETGEPGERNGVVRHQPRAQDGPEGLGHHRTQPRPARRPRRSAGWSATCTTASRRCSRSSSTPECSWAPRRSPRCPPAT